MVIGIENNLQLMPAMRAPFFLTIMVPIVVMPVMMLMPVLHLLDEA
jgi:hypothetical protein